MPKYIDAFFGRMGNSFDKITDNLYLGDRSVYDDASFIQFTTIVTALSKGELQCWRIREKIAAAGTNWLFIPVDDDERVMIYDHFQQVNEFVEAALGRGERVLIHCAAGISRSTTLMAAYLMWKNGWTRDAAIDHIKERRSQIGPNDGFMAQLLAYELQRTPNIIVDENVGIRENVESQNDTKYV